MKVSKIILFRVVLLIVVLVNLILSAVGASPLPFGEAEIYEIVVNLDYLISVITTVIAALWAAWKDNDITEKARRRKELGTQALEEEMNSGKEEEE